MAEKRDYYDILGVGKTASPDEIKKAFRKLAVKHHPDKEGGDELKFKEAAEAYEVLSNPEKKQRYDQFGHAGVGGGAGGPAGGAGFGGFDFSGGGFSFDLGDLGLDDILGSFFGGGRRSSAAQSGGADLQTTITLNFEEAVFGVEKKLDITTDLTCTHCKGRKAEPGSKLKDCSECSGSGHINQAFNTPFGRINQEAVCRECSGEGKIPELKCTVCSGRGVTRQTEEVKVKIPAGVDDGSALRVAGKGATGSDGSRGDLYVEIRVKAHKKFTRESFLILSSEQIDMVDAALGCEIEVDTVDGGLKVKIPAGTQSGTDLKLSGKGVPYVRGSGRGDHIVTIHVKTPVNLSKKQKDLLEDFKTAKKRGLFR
jgi:molecular chaperone DnaJ